MIYLDIIYIKTIISIKYTYILIILIQLHKKMFSKYLEQYSNLQNL